MPLLTREKRKYAVPILLVIILICLFTVFGKRGLIRVYELTQERDSIESYNEGVRAENSALKDEIQRLKTDARYIELVARKDLGMVGKNEIVYQFDK